MDRKNFLKRSLIGLLGVAASGKIVKAFGDDDMVTISSVSRESDSMQLPLINSDTEIMWSHDNKTWITTEELNRRNDTEHQYFFVFMNKKSSSN